MQISGCVTSSHLPPPVVCYWFGTDQGLVFPWRVFQFMQPMPRKLLLAIPVSFLFASLCFAQAEAIQGDVKGEDGKPVVGAVIKIERTDIKQNYTVKTDKKGH